MTPHRRDEVIEHNPDLLLIYAGHNEYYGALGVGSTESIGNARWLVKTYLNLCDFKHSLTILFILSESPVIIFKGKEF